MADHLPDDVEAFFRAQRDRPLGDAQLASGRTLQPISRGLHDAAINLLTKAARCLAAGDRADALRFVDRAVALPFDDHEECSPAAAAGQQLVYNAVTDAVEESPSDDPTWLDAALAALAGAGLEGGAVLKEVLRDILPVYDLTDRERRRLRAATADAPKRGELVDRPLAQDELGAVLVEVLEVVNAYAAELASRRS